MRIGIMQPYFLPYAGYWQLIRSCDLFVLNDDVQFIRHGWIARNRVLKPGGGWQYVVVPLVRHASTAPIRAVRIHEEADWRRRLLGQLEHYRRLAPHHGAVVGLLADILGQDCGGSIARLNLNLITRLAPMLGIQTPIRLQSELGLDYSSIRATADWSIQVTRQLGGDRYINPISGAALYDAADFARHGIALEFLAPASPTYDQGRPFEAGLSIIDLLMFLGPEEAGRALEGYAVVSAGAGELALP